MCGRLGVSGRVIVPGTVMQFAASRGNHVGTWGIPGWGKMIHNARIESMSRYWRNIKDNRGILPVSSFIEPEGPIFGLKDSRVVNLGVIYDASNRFVVVTQDSFGIVKDVHPRMPVIVTDRDKWLLEGGLSNPPDELLTVLGNAGPDTNQF